MPPLDALPLEAVLEAGYACLLLAIALGLEYVARRTHAHANRTHLIGFRYHPHLDRWECPQGQHLVPIETDYRRGLTRYRARRDACARCPLKADCTDGDDGREVVWAPDTWPQSEIAHFHRGLSLLLVLLSGVVAGVGLVRHHGAAEVVVLGMVLGLALVMGQRLIPGFRAFVGP